MGEAPLIILAFKALYILPALPTSVPTPSLHSSSFHSCSPLFLHALHLRSLPLPSLESLSGPQLSIGGRHRSQLLMLFPDHPQTGPPLPCLWNLAPAVLQLSTVHATLPHNSSCTEGILLTPSVRLHRPEVAYWLYLGQGSASVAQRNLSLELAMLSTRFPRWEVGAGASLSCSLRL